MRTTTDAIDRFVTAVDSGRLRRDLIDLFDDEPFSRIEEWAESLTEIAEQIGTARDAIESWADEDDREMRTALRDDALDALEQLVTVWQASPLDVSSLHDYEPPEDDE
jgi:hypothetical protein